MKLLGNVSVMLNMCAGVHFLYLSSMLPCLLSEYRLSKTNHSELLQQATHFLAAHRLHNLCRRLFKLTKYFSGSGGVEHRPAPLAVAEEGKAKVQSFLEHLPLINAICNPGLQERHWAVSCVGSACVQLRRDVLCLEARMEVRHWAVSAVERA